MQTQPVINRIAFNIQHIQDLNQTQSPADYRNAPYQNTHNYVINTALGPGTDIHLIPLQDCYNHRYGGINAERNKQYRYDLIFNVSPTGRGHRDLVSYPNAYPDTPQ